MIAQPENLFDRIARNQRDSYLLIGTVVALIVILGYVLGAAMGNPTMGLGIAMIFALFQTAISVTAGDSILLALSGAKEIQKSDNPVLFDVVAEMAVAGGIPMPKVFIINDNAPNAFATGRNPQNSDVAVTVGLLKRLDREELQAVIGHEMSHVRDNDVFFATLMGVMVGSIALLCDFFGRFRMGESRDDDNRGNGLFIILWILLSILAPIVAYIIQMAMSREREYLADAGSAELTRNPLALASALEKISSDPETLTVANRATQHLYIVNPLHDANEEKPSLFDTHPPTSERIRILREMAHTMAKSTS